MPSLLTGIAQMREPCALILAVGFPLIEGLNWTCGCRHIRLAFNCSPGAARGSTSRAPRRVFAYRREALFGPFPVGALKRVAPPTSRLSTIAALTCQRSGRTPFATFQPSAVCPNPRQNLDFPLIDLLPQSLGRRQGPILWLLVREVVPTPAMINWLVGRETENSDEY